MKKKMIALMLCVTTSVASTTCADFSLTHGIDKTLSDKNYLIIAGLAIVALTRAKTIVDYSPVYFMEQGLNQFLRGTSNPNERQPYTIFPKTAEAIMCGLFGTLCLAAFTGTVINNSYQ